MPIKCIPVEKPTADPNSSETAGRRTTKTRHRSTPPRSKADNQALPPEILSAINQAVEDTLRRRHVEAQAFSIEEFCAVYGVSRTTAYEQMNKGLLVAKKPVGSKRTLILKADAERWIANAPAYKPGHDRDNTEQGAA
jgi:predicted DNA-binding transcriptional regulator AlpA